MWFLLFIVAVEILVTYSRVPTHELYHVSVSGFFGGASRVLVFSNFPVALVAIPVLALRAGRGWSRVALVAAVLCAAVFWPGVVDQSDLDARPVNAIAAAGVLIAVVLTAIDLRCGLAWSGRCAGDGARIVVASLALLVGLPWLAAELGFFLDDLPGPGWLFLTGSHGTTNGPAVHHGDHHGMDGVLLLLCAAMLSRVVPPVPRRGLRVAIGAYLALMASYGIANIADDAWYEQIVKRGWISWKIPNVLEPKATLAWALILAASGALYAGAVWWRRRAAGRPVSVDQLSVQAGV